MDLSKDDKYCVIMLVSCVAQASNTANGSIHAIRSSQCAWLAFAMIDGGTSVSNKCVKTLIILKLFSLMTVVCP